MGSETWTYDTTNIVKISGDYTTLYPVNSRIKLVQSGVTKYFVVTVSQLVGSETKLTLDGQGLYTLANDIISSHLSTTWKTPSSGFPLEDIKTYRIDHVIMWGSASPSTGTWSVGDICFNSNPSSGNPIGWMCTVTGSPGTWNAMSNLV